MRMYDLIEKKKRGGSLLTEEIAYMVRGFVAGDIPDYQMSAMLMAVYFKGMDDREITDLTLEMAHSGDMVDLSPIEGIKADKHSTGGVGDKTTLGDIVPLWPPMRRRGGQDERTGPDILAGTVISWRVSPGLRLHTKGRIFPCIINENGLALIGQSGNMVPADKKALCPEGCDGHRDSIPLLPPPS